MTEKKLDRRILRTRRMLREALLELLETVDYDSLTVTEVTEAADIRRGTFYLHYENVDALLDAVLVYVFEDIAQKYAAKRLPFYQPGKKPFLLLLAKYLKQNAELYQRLLTGQARSRLYLFLYDFLAEVIQRDLDKLPDNASTLPLPIVTHHVASSCSAMLLWWLDNDLSYSPQEMAGMIQTLTLQGISGMITLPDKSP